MIDLRSDTVTKPTQQMREAMYVATVGDDVYGDDGLTKELEDYAADITNKEAALFVPSGTFANQLAILTHTHRADEIILGETSHIVAHEAGASALIAGVQLRTVKTDNGIFDIENLKKMIREEDVHFPNTGLICVENAHGNGCVVPVDNMRLIYEVAQQKGIPVHLDGARLFNAATALGVSVDVLTQYSDSVNICLSKGLCAPIGSLLVGSKTFIKRARKNRKKMGGGMRQTGILASAGLIALKQMTKRLKEDHLRAERLAEKLNKIDEIEIIQSQRDINMIFFKLSETIISETEFVEALKKEGILINGTEDGYYRFVVHYWITDDDVQQIATCLASLIDAKVNEQI